jgi:hypothetical protein
MRNLKKYTIFYPESRRFFSKIWTKNRHYTAKKYQKYSIYIFHPEIVQT